MKKTPFCKDCRFYKQKTICLHPKTKGIKHEHITSEFWCIYGEWRVK